MRIYEKPCMIVTNYNAVDRTNLTLNASYAIGVNTDSKNMSNQSFKLHSLNS